MATPRRRPSSRLERLLARRVTAHAGSRPTGIRVDFMHDRAVVFAAAQESDEATRVRRMRT